MFLALLAIPALAFAEGNGNNLGPPMRLHVDGYCLDSVTFDDSDGEPPITDAWVSTQDSPTDAQNNKALRVVIPGSTAECLYYVEAFTQKSTGLNVPVEKLRNLSFEFRNTDTFGGGAPRFSVITNDGDVAFADAAGCNNPLQVRPSWSRADFTGRKALGCTITDGAGTPYSSDGTDSAWKNYADANPGESVTLVVMVIDAQAVPVSSGGTYTLYRIAIPNGNGAPAGTGTRATMFNNTNSKGYDCTSEAAC